MTTITDPKKTIMKARALVSTTSRWTQGYNIADAFTNDGTPCSVRSLDASVFTIVGALKHAAYFSRGDSEQNFTTALMTLGKNEASLRYWNNKRASHADVLSMLDKAIDFGAPIRYNLGEAPMSPVIRRSPKPVFSEVYR